MPTLRTAAEAPIVSFLFQIFALTSFHYLTININLAQQTLTQSPLLDILLPTNKMIILIFLVVFCGNLSCAPFFHTALIKLVNSIKPLWIFPETRVFISNSIAKCHVTQISYTRVIGVDSGCDEIIHDSQHSGFIEAIPPPISHPLNA